jgi:poly(3-hydroxybutyrate) depolymerase
MTFRSPCGRLLVGLMAACLALAPAASAQRVPAEIQAKLDAIDKETACFLSPGPGDGEQRAMCVWRPAGSEGKVLPTLYMMDGMDGIHVLLLDFKAALDAGKVAPLMIVATDPRAKPEERAAEYLRTFPGGRKAYDLHEAWLLTKVIAWAEETQHASPERNKRFIGGFSNGADLALSVAQDHPDVFGGALIHSPFGLDDKDVSGIAKSQRWVVTGGTLEKQGSVKQGGQGPRYMAGALRRNGDAVRSCIGRWKHEGKAWRQLTPGSLTWLMGLGDPKAVETELERQNCQLLN